MDRYQRVDKPKEESKINENEIRVTSQGRVRNYISYATLLLQEKKVNEIVFKAMGRAIGKTVMIVELIKRSIVGLHQNTSITSSDIIDSWEPLEEGLLPLETTRHVSIITITLSTKELDDSSIGYQTPLPCDQVKQWSEFDNEGDLEVSPGGRGKRRGRGLRGRGRGRARGDSFLGDEGLENRGHSFQGGNDMEREYGRRGDYQYEAGDYNAEAPASALVRGRDRRRGRAQIHRGFRPNGSNQVAAVAN